MVFDVRCFKCGEHGARLVLGGRSIIHARCHACGANLLAEVMAFEQEVMAAQQANDAPTTQSLSAIDLESEEDKALPQA
jgi:DNA-directed RNA polymerase subunit N (RpoN/RPB10)